MVKQTKEPKSYKNDYQSGMTLGQIIELKEACYQQGKAQALKQVMEIIDEYEPHYYDSEVDTYDKWTQQLKEELKSKLKDASSTENGGKE